MLELLRRKLVYWRVIAVFGTICVASQTLRAKTVHALGSDMLRVQTTLEPRVVRAIVAHWEATGLIDSFGRTTGTT
jgi:hypothetical protein